MFILGLVYYKYKIIKIHMNIYQGNNKSHDSHGDDSTEVDLSDAL